MISKGYLIPAEPNPTDDVCIRVYVPNDPLYIAAFWGSYEFLTAWLAWERDVNKRGVLAAARWKDSYLRARDEWECSQGDCGIMDIRQNPTAPCVIDKQTSCDGTWESAVNMQLCVPRMRLVSTGNGVVLEQWNGTEWVPARDPETDEPYEDRYNGPYVPQWANPPVGEAGNCLAAVNVGYTLQQQVNQIAQYHVDAAAFLTILSSFTAAVALWVDFPLQALAADLIAVFADFAGDWVDVRDYDTLPPFVILSLCYFEPNGSITRENFEDLLADIANYRSGLAEAYKRVKWALILIAMRLLGNVGISRMAASAGIQTGACEGIDCGWFVEFDFRLNDWDWTPETHLGLPAGEWQEGVGWVGVYAGSLGSTGSYRAFLRSPIKTSADYWKGLIEAEYLDPESNYWRRHLWILDGETVEGAFISEEVYGDLPEDEIVVGDGSLTGTSARVWVGSVNTAGAQPPQGDIGGVVIKRVKLWGLGTNPWE